MLVGDGYAFGDRRLPGAGDAVDQNPISHTRDTSRVLVSSPLGGQAFCPRRLAHRSIETPRSHLTGWTIADPPHAGTYPITKEVIEPGRSEMGGAGLEPAATCV